jgi:putative FmdB family regulatory protein
MPIYEFQCNACGVRVDELMRLTDPDPVDCPSCGEPALKRLVSAPQFRLAGGGWYETDFKGDKDKKRNLAGESDAKPADKADAKAETRPEAKSDAKPEAKPEPAKPATPPAASGD